MIFCLLGAGVLFPWNAWITPYDYFESLYKDYPFQFWISVIFNSASVSFMFISVKFAAKFSITFRMVFGLLIDLFILIIVPLIPYFHMGTPASFYVTMVLVFFTGFANAILFTSLLGHTSSFQNSFQVLAYSHFYCCRTCSTFSSKIHKLCNDWPGSGRSDCGSYKKTRTIVT